MELTIGIDEAGRGPVIGPLVMCGVSATKQQIEQLKKLGVKDSKLIPAPKREILFEQIKEIITDYKIRVVEPAEIDAALASPTMNLNWLEATHSADITNQLSGTSVILDCPSTNPPAYTSYFRELLSRDMHIVCEHKADANYPVVSAASILAKVIRDRAIEQIKSDVGSDVGSGYPSDPTTQQFLKDNWNKYDCFRKSWASYKKIEESKSQSSLADF